MINDIEIENFRCFEHTKIEGFERVNLIGGKNNSGKTALLEAIAINQSPQPDMILFLTKLRDDSLHYSTSYPEKTWDALFFNNQTEKYAKVTIKSFGHQQVLLLSANLQLNSNFKVSEKDQKSLKSNTVLEALNYSQYLTIELQADHLGIDKYLLRMANSIGEGIKLDIEVLLKPMSILNKFSITQTIKSKYDFKEFISASKIDLMIQYISASFRLNKIEIIKEYSNVELKNRGHHLINILQRIDPKIQEIKIFSIREPILYLKRENEQFLPISMFGDAINRAIEIMVKILNNESSIILIDEIENGIHYTSHRDFWKALFEISKELDVQIFATTHSLEMIQAFRDIGLNHYADSGSYFTMTKHYKTSKIIGIKRELETLDYAIEHGKEVRGE
ncbi:AAA family ATPase [Crocosphaera sp. Alani8]|uniref:AAA family ATPase n=1 Tax=Crocosphaera sp. Alani8 TaxID=3038952 RepID=UPI00313ADBE3